MKHSTTRKRVISPEGRANMKAAQARRWAAIRGEAPSGEQSQVSDALLKAEKTVAQQVEILIDRLNAREKPILLEISECEARLKVLFAQSEEIGDQKDALSEALKRLSESKRPSEPATLKMGATT